MNNQEFVLQTMRETGRAKAQQLQENADNMTGTELYAQEDYIPDFRKACETQNMLTRKIGFVCRSSAGRVVRLIQPYDSEIYEQEPEELTAHWGFKWSQDPKKAKPFVKITTSPFMQGDCCVEDGEVYRSKENNNTYAPSEYPPWWEVAE